MYKFGNPSYMRLTLTLFFSVFFSLISLAQKGSYYLVQYDLMESGLNNFNYNIVQGPRGLVYMANLRGVVVSDGRDWSLIETPYSIFALDFDSSNNLYVGGRGEIAVIENAHHLQDSYRLISKVKQEIFDVKYHKNKVYFLSENTLYIYEIASKKLATIEKPSSDIFSSFTVIEGTIYVSSVNSGLQVINNNLLEPNNLELPANSLGVICSKSETQFVFTKTGDYFIREKGQKSYKEFQINDDDYIEQNTPVNISWVNANVLAISTISGGVVFVNATTGEVDQFMNFENGLADNEVLTLFVGKHNLVWCATPQGVSIIAPEMPIRNYSSYKGLVGNIQVVHNFHNRLFIGTSVGLYELVKKSLYEDVVSYKKTTKQVKSSAKQAETQKKKGLFRRKNKRKTVVTSSKRQTKIYYKKHVQKQLISQKFEFEKIQNIDAKIVQLLNFNGKLLIGSLAGIYQLDGQDVSQIFEDPIVYMYKPKHHNFLMASTYTKEVKVIKPTGDKWETTGLLDGLNDIVEQIQQGKNGSLWLCGADSVYRVVLSNASTLEDVEVYHINNPHLERIFTSPYQGKTYFINTSGYYYYTNHSIKKDTVIEHLIGLPQEIILSAQNKLWVNTGNLWYGQGEDLNSSLNFISLFEDPKAISELGNSNLWIVAGDNQLYKVNSDEIKSISRNFDLFLEMARMDSVSLPITNFLGDIDQKSTLSFKFSSPDFTNFFQIEYQYRLVGLSKDWSGWDKNNNNIVFPFLPADTYQLEVRARDALGNIQNADPIKFRILAPYWKRPWFYLIEFLFFGGLMTLSIFVNRKKAEFTLLSRLLTFLTLIFIVEFVQTIAEAKFETDQSPVINFFIQVAIALSILPAESLLRKFITKKKESENIEENSELAQKQKE